MARVGGFIKGDEPKAHHDRMSDPSVRYLRIIRNDKNVGFAILKGLGSIHRNIELKRYVISQPGGGIGQIALRVLMDYVFVKLEANRLWLDTLESNERAQHVYKKCNFKEDGRLREDMWMNGKFHDAILFSILAKEYNAL